MAATVTVHVVAQPVHYVALNSTNPVPPYSSWATAATNIQDAVDAATCRGRWCVVSNGVYQSGGAGGVWDEQPGGGDQAGDGAERQRAGGDKHRRLPGARATNGPAAVRCVYLTNGAVLAGFTLTNGATQSRMLKMDSDFGRGVWCESASAVVSNCVLTGNSALGGGGGAYNGTLNNCTLTGNSAGNQGGGACNGTLNNCTLTGNSASMRWRLLRQHAQQLHADGQFG